MVISSATSINLNANTAIVLSSLARPVTLAAYNGDSRIMVGASMNDILLSTTSTIILSAPTVCIPSNTGVFKIGTDASQDTPGYAPFTINLNVPGDASGPYVTMSLGSSQAISINNSNVQIRSLEANYLNASSFAFSGVTASHAYEHSITLSGSTESFQHNIKFTLINSVSGSYSTLTAINSALYSATYSSMSRVLHATGTYMNSSLSNADLRFINGVYRSAATTLGLSCYAIGNKRGETFNISYDRYTVPFSGIGVNVSDVVRKLV